MSPHLNSSDCECDQCCEWLYDSDIDDSDYEPEIEEDSDSEEDLDEITDEELIELGREFLDIVADLGRNYRVGTRNVPTPLD